MRIYTYHMPVAPAPFTQPARHLLQLYQTRFLEDMQSKGQAGAASGKQSAPGGSSKAGSGAGASSAAAGASGATSQPGAVEADFTRPAFIAAAFVLVAKLRKVGPGLCCAFQEGFRRFALCPGRPGGLVRTVMMAAQRQGLFLCATKSVAKAGRGQRTPAAQHTT